VVEERYTESGEISRRVLLVVAPRDQVEPYIEACRSAGLRLAGIQVDRKVLADIAVRDPRGFAGLVEVARGGLGE